MRRFFFHSPTATPVLLKVEYNITFADGFVTNVENEVIPSCSNSLINSTLLELEQTNLTLGWTSSGVYVVFHPAVLSVMQVQSPFSLLSIFHLTLDERFRSPESDSFLWDGSYELPTVNINLHITSLLCVPSNEVFESLLHDLNSLVSIKQFAGYVLCMGMELATLRVCQQITAPLID